MNAAVTRRILSCLVVFCAALCLTACANSQTNSQPTPQEPDALDTSKFLVSVLDEPDTEDFQCSTINYTIALNTFDRLAEIESQPDGSVDVVPSLAESWEISDDGLQYTFHLRKGVTFSNGAPLTSSDVLYSFTRLLTHPNSHNQDIVKEIVGAPQLAEGTADTLEGFRIIDDHTFTITLAQPFAAFLSCLCMPGASIMDEESATKAGDAFGVDPTQTIGTGPFIFKEWNAGKNFLLVANPTYWAGKPSLEGLDLRFVYDPDNLRQMAEDGKLDILNLDNLGDLSEYYLHGDAYQDKIQVCPHIGIDYIALNESVEPLNDVRVRKALQLATNRQMLLDAVYAGAGHVENGIYPHGLLGFNPDLPVIPYDPDQARALLAEAGYPDGFDLAISVNSTSTRGQRQVMELVSTMWAKVGVRTTITVLDENDFMSQRMSGQLACYTATWAADYDDPDNFIYTFFGTRENTTFRSLCYADDDTMARVRNARSIMDEDARIREYDDLEQKVIQDDAAWVPLFSKERHYLVSDRVENFTTAWNGWFETSYKYMSIKG